MNFDQKIELDVYREYTEWLRSKTCTSEQFYMSFEAAIITLNIIKGIIMPRARKTLISLEDTHFYHCVSRCVRRAYLCGEDTVTKTSYEHRRQWVEDRLIFLAGVFAIDVCAYAVMSNHTHVVLHVNSDEASSLSKTEVIRRWHRLHKGTLLTNWYIDPEQREKMNDAMIETVEETVEVWRQRLINISWFMRSLNEYIAREANKEDECTGRFWEGRFKSQALLDETAVAACMAYVDLNPVRAKMATSPENSDYTSVKHRLNVVKKGETAEGLMPFTQDRQNCSTKSLPFTFHDYMYLLDMTGMRLAEDDNGVFKYEPSLLLLRLNLKVDQWQELSTSFESCFYSAVGSEGALVKYQKRQNLKHIKGKRNARRLLNSA